MANVVNEIMSLINNGWRAYRGEVDGQVYARVGCRRPGSASWFVRGKSFLCLGCSRRCAEMNPAGFQAALPEGEAHTGFEYSLTPMEMVQKKVLLRADEAAYCLSVSARKIYDLAKEGRLVSHVDKPLRVTAESVLEEMKRVDW